MIINQTPYPISFEREMSQALTCRYGEEFRQYIMKPDINVSGLSCLLQIAKPDGTFTENGVEVHTDPDTGECALVLTIPKQATVVKGVARYSICCYGEVETETHLLYSAEGPLWVDDDLITEEMIQSVAEVNGLVFPQDFLTVDMIPDLAREVSRYVLPVVLPAERGFYLRASHDTGDPEWAPIDMPYPGFGPLDAGKSLMVNASGTNVEWKKVQHDYSTQEQIVGKWIDGKDIYEITIENELSLTGSWQQYFDASEIDNIIDVVMRTKRDGEEASPAFSIYENATWLKRSGYIQVSCNAADWKLLSMTVRYTKL